VFDPKWQSSGLKMMEFSNSVNSDHQNHLDLTSVITGHATRATDVAGDIVGAADRHADRTGLTWSRRLPTANRFHSGVLYLQPVDHHNVGQHDGSQ
jgi:hypothetical protein